MTKDGKIIVGVMGPGKEATKEDSKRAYELGKLIAEEGWIVLSGGVASGVMDAVNKGVKEKGGVTIGILAKIDSKISAYVDIPIMTDLGSARNTINVATSDILVACGIGPGTASEISFALQKWARKPVVLLNDNISSKNFFTSLDKELVHIAENPEEVVRIVKTILK